MLTSRQSVILELLTASIIAQKVNPTDCVHSPELTKEVIKKLEILADIFLEVTDKPFL